MTHRKKDFITKTYNILIILLEFIYSSYKGKYCATLYLDVSGVTIDHLYFKYFTEIWKSGSLYCFYVHFGSPLSFMIIQRLARKTDYFRVDVFHV